MAEEEFDVSLRLWNSCFFEGHYVFFLFSKRSLQLAFYLCVHGVKTQTQPKTNSKNKPLVSLFDSHQGWVTTKDKGRSRKRSRSVPLILHLPTPATRLGHWGALWNPPFGAESFAHCTITGRAPVSESVSFFLIFYIFCVTWFSYFKLTVGFGTKIGCSERRSESSH